MNHLTETLSKPCLIERVEGALVIEPLRFISTYQVYAKGRIYAAVSKSNYVRPSNHAQRITL